MQTTVQDILTYYRSKIDSLDVELIIAKVINRTREFVLTHPEFALTEEQCAEIEAFLKRRFNHEPLAYLLGHREFFGLDFDMTPDTLIPRPETELMVEEVLKCAKFENIKTSCIIDVGTGSGCIIISLAKELPKNQTTNIHSTFFGVDISQPALEIAKLNAKKHNLEKNITFIQSDLLETISQEIIDKHFDSLIIAANLPYLSQTIYQSSMPDVQNFEPRSALVSKEDGLSHYKKLLEQMQSIHTKKPAMFIKLFFEISPEQNIAIKNLIREYFPQANIKIKKDLANKSRLAIVAL
jgi:release factor glutamine methyltransferase